METIKIEKRLINNPNWFKPYEMLPVGARIDKFEGTRNWIWEDSEFSYYIDYYGTRNYDYVKIEWI